MDCIELIKNAENARKHSYSPYSCFSVGAALLCEDGTVYLGANIENASYGATNCAERTAIFKAVFDGHRKFKAIAIVGGKHEQKPDDYAYPCGVCRQVMSEYFDKDTKIYVAKSEEDYKVFTFDEILPNRFEL